MSELLSNYIEDLRLGWETTNEAEDRPRYESLLAQLAIVLAKVNLNVPESELFEAIDNYERLWGNTWLLSWNPQHPESSELFKPAAGSPVQPPTKNVRAVPPGGAVRRTRAGVPPPLPQALGVIYGLRTYHGRTYRTDWCYYRQC